MIPKVSWLTAADTLIIWWMSEHRYRVAVTAAIVSTNIGLSQSHVNRRMNLLEAGGLIEEAENVDKRGYYQISDLGERYIIGDCSLDELEQRDPTDD